MRKFFTTAFVLAATMVIATSGLALEKTAARMDEGHADFWSQDYSCSVAYYNYCTGWIWCWTGWSPLDFFGTVFNSCCATGEGSLVAAGWAYCCTGAPSGYGFTGNFGLWDAPAGFPAAPLMVAPLLPVSGWNGAGYGLVVTGPFAQCFENGPGTGSTAGFATDHPAVGPSGPQACGYCYPSPRTTFSYYFGTVASPLCPGSPMNDGICDCDLMFDVAINCIVGVEDSSWGTIKAIYR